MKVFIVHAHPEPQSFNGTLTRFAKDTLISVGHEVTISDLYQMNFEPVSNRHNFTSCQNPDYYKQQLEEKLASEVNGFAPDIAAEIDKLFWCDVLIFQFPLWWFGLPGILKGWVDRVFVMGRIYGEGKWFDNGVFKGKRAMLSLTTGGVATFFSETGLSGNIHHTLNPINYGIFRFTGFDVLPPFIAWAVSRVGEQQRQAYLQDYKQRLLTLEQTPPLVYPSLAEYDENFQLKKSCEQAKT